MLLLIGPDQRCVSKNPNWEFKFYLQDIELSMFYLQLQSIDVIF